MSKREPAQSIVKDVFDAAVGMKPGSRIPMHFNSPGQCESFRVRFYNEKRRYALAFGEVEADTVFCTRVNQLTLMIEKTEQMHTPCIIDSDGTITPIETKVCAPTVSLKEFLVSMNEVVKQKELECLPAVDYGAGLETEEQRRERLMRESEFTKGDDNDT